jgi:hypothetical protein
MNEGPIFLKVIELGSEFEIGNSCLAFEMLPSRRNAKEIILTLFRSGVVEISSASSHK